MKPRRKSEENPTTEFGNFSRLLDKLLGVPHDDIKAELDAEKERNVVAGGPHQRGKYKGLSLNVDQNKLGVRHFSRFLRSGLPHSQQFGTRSYAVGGRVGLGESGDAEAGRGRPALH
jgi:hypothetical protein